MVHVFQSCRDKCERQTSECSSSVADYFQLAMIGLCQTSSIYCTPYDAEYILKINTIQGTVKKLDNVELPETSGLLWTSGALAPDNNIYYMSSYARRIMRLSPDNDSLTSVGDDLGDGWKYSGTVVGNDNCV